MLFVLKLKRETYYLDHVLAIFTKVNFYVDRWQIKRRRLFFRTENEVVVEKTFDFKQFAIPLEENSLLHSSFFLTSFIVVFSKIEN